MSNNELKKNKQTARDMYNNLVEGFIYELEQGVNPWSKSWNLKNGLPKSAVSGGEYSGINILSLINSKFKSSSWITQKQVTNLGGTIKDEEFEKGKDIFFLKNVTKNIEIKDEDTGEFQEKEENYKVLRNYKVFNIEQVEGINFPQEEKRIDKSVKIKEVEKFIESLDINLFRGEPAYSPRDDAIFMPEISEFKDKENYYSTMFHEVGHWSGHSNRLDRQSRLWKKYDKEKAYAVEELVAELTSAFLCSRQNIGMENTQHTEYLNSWVSALKENPYILFSVSSQASKATNYLHKLSNKNLNQNKEKLKTKKNNNSPKVA